MNISQALPENITCMIPQSNPDTWKLMQEFYIKYYNDHKRRVLIFGINPGRYGGGLTGIPFTDPFRLESFCGIHNSFRKLPELSSEFVYRIIDAYGGPGTFYEQFLFTSLSPIGFTRDRKNLNYYDDKQLRHSISPFIEDCIEWQLRNLSVMSTCYCLGEGENFKYFSILNGRKKYFREIISLPHPRWVMQYRRKKLDEYVQLYVDKLRKSSMYQ
jgi:hypothetical protein